MKRIDFRWCLALFLLFLYPFPAVGQERVHQNDPVSHYFEIVGRGDEAALLALCHRGLQGEIDAPVLKAWIDACNEHLGRFETILPGTLATGSRTEGGKEILTFSCRVRLSKGLATSTLSLVEGQLIGFSVQSESIPAWFFKNDDWQNFYQEGGSRFLSDFLSGRSGEAYKKWIHRDLKQAVTLEKFTQMAQEVQENGGSLKGCLFKEKSLDQSRAALYLAYELEFEKARCLARVKFLLDGLKARVAEFDINPGN